MLSTLGLLSVLFVRSFRSRHNLLLENLALRQQLAVLKQSNTQPRFSAPDRFFWVQPDTVVRWHRAGFKLYWRWISRHRTKVGRKPTSKELCALIFKMVAENPTWGSAAYSWRTEDARLRHFGENRAALDEESAKKP